MNLDIRMIVTACTAGTVVPMSQRLTVGSHSEAKRDTTWEGQGAAQDRDIENPCVHCDVSLRAFSVQNIILCYLTENSSRLLGLCDSLLRGQKGICEAAVHSGAAALQVATLWPRGAPRRAAAALRPVGLRLHPLNRRVHSCSLETDHPGAWHVRVTPQDAQHA